MKLNKAYPLIVILLLFTFFTVSAARAQPVWNGDVTISDAGDIAALAGYTEITGAVIIESSTLTDLDGLESLSVIGFSLDIINCPLLNDLTGLANLNTLWYDLWIDNNAALTSLEGLNSLDFIGGDQITITDNGNLNNLGALYDTDVIGGLVTITDNAMFSNSEAFALVTNWSPPTGVFNGYAMIGNNGGGLTPTDTDGDGIPDDDDNCPSNCNTEQSDYDGDGVGDVCDTDGKGCSDGCGSPSCEQECVI